MLQMLIMFVTLCCNILYLEVHPHVCVCVCVWCARVRACNTKRTLTASLITKLPLNGFWSMYVCFQRLCVNNLQKTGCVLILYKVNCVYRRL